ncbi:MAG: 16S rRNA (cytosine(1402)-N(4))-methyltransferase RsmH [Dethiobacteria bacterium]|jgi:16S rRNA (cytosine1402-N4)-methyltransferase
MAPKWGNYRHTPVMLSEVLKFLQPSPGKIIVDATLGGGGHAAAIIKQLLPTGKLVGIDCDQDALQAAQKRLSAFDGAFQVVKANFREIKEISWQLGFEAIDGLLLDLGVSSYQLDCPERGFSYRDDVFLDMRMDQALSQTAAVLLAELSPKQLAKVFRAYGEERWAQRIASLIVKYRQTRGPVSRSGQLVEIIREAIPAPARRRGGHPAKRVFQALRIAVNEELDNLKSGLSQGIKLLKPGGRVVVIAYHSLEDGIVKKQFREDSRGCICPPGMPVCGCGKTPLLKILTKKPLLPGKEELARNRRAKSARLRAAEKC